jgi:aromatic-L-amino-acid decarboxylase
MHALLDKCCDRMESYRNLPWIQPPKEMNVHIDRNNGQSMEQVLDRMTEDIMPFATGNTHPRFLGWVHGAGIPSCVAADLVQSTMNSNCGGRHQGAAEVERECISWLCEKAGFQEDETSKPFGVLTSGTSQSTILALLAARAKKFGYDVRQKGILGLPPVRLYVSEAAHSCLARGMECLGHGSDSVARVPIDPTSGSMNIKELERMILEDEASGYAILGIVGTCGSVSVGAYDDFAAIHALAAQHNTWFHVDAAFGFWIRLSNDAKLSSLADGIEHADSVALDAHKWPGVQYDCGALLVNDKDHLRRTLVRMVQRCVTLFNIVFFLLIFTQSVSLSFNGKAMRPAYLQSADSGLAGGDLWYTDYSLDLSRGFRALKLWTALSIAGGSDIGAVVTDHCQMAAQMGRLVQESPVLELAHPVISNICCFYPKPKNVARENTVPTAADIAATLQVKGQGVYSTISLNNRLCLRAAIVNHRITPDDVKSMVGAAEAVIMAGMG